METNRRLCFIDSFRGIAAMYVLVYHLALSPPFKPPLPEALYGFIMLGRSGVMLFFVISAFSLCLTMPRHMRQEAPLTSFYISRIFRIAPLFFFMLAFSLWRDWDVYGVIHDIPTLILNTTFLYNFSPTHQFSIVWAGWTIGVEMIFYAIFPLIYRMFSTMQLRIAGFFISSIIAVLAPILLPTAMGEVPVTRFMPVFFVGMITFSIYEKINSGNLSNRRYLGLTLICGGILGFAYLDSTPIERLPLLNDKTIWMGIFYAVIIIGVSLSNTLSSPKSIFTKLGEWSFSIYLIHAPVMFYLSPAYEWIYGFTELPNGVLFFICLLITLVIVLPLSWSAYNKIEIPGIILGRKVFSYISSSRVNRLQ